MPALTADRLRELLEYDPETGVFKWRVQRKKAKPGDVAGCISVKRYRMISIDGVTHLAHRLAWLHYYGSWPQVWLDHINGDRFDNRIANLREASAAQSAWNRPGQKQSKSKIKGVHPRARGRFEAWIMRAGKNHYLGRFLTSEAAASAYAEAAVRLHGEFARMGGAQP